MFGWWRATIIGMLMAGAGFVCSGSRAAHAQECPPTGGVELGRAGESQTYIRNLRLELGEPNDYLINQSRRVGLMLGQSLPGFNHGTHLWRQVSLSPPHQPSGWACKLLPQRVIGGRSRKTKGPAQCGASLGHHQTGIIYLPHHVKFEATKSPGWNHTTGVEETSIGHLGVGGHHSCMGFVG
jgi:hypothetical protein